MSAKTKTVLTFWKRWKRFNSKSVKKTLSIPKWLNDEAVKANAPFSNILQSALQEYLAK